MKTLLLIAVSLTASILLNSGSAQAAKVNLMDCPCHDAMFIAAGLVSCSATFTYSQIRSPKGQFSKLLINYEQAGGNCAFFSLIKRGVQRSIDVQVGTEISNGVSCPGIATNCSRFGMTDVQFKACDTLLKGIKRDFSKLPDC